MRPRSSSRLAVRAALLSLVTHAVVVLCALEPGWRSEPLLAPDSPTYIRPAENLLLHGAFSREAEPPFRWEPHRTVGYPLIIAGVLLLCGDARWVMLIAALTAAAAAWCAVELVRRWGGSARAEHIAAVAAALLPNSLGLSGQILTDALTGHLTLVWIFASLLALGGGSTWALVAACALVAVLQAFKPTFNLIALLVPAVLLCSGRSKGSLAKALAMVAISAVMPGLHAVRNAQDHGVLSPTLLGATTLREYLQVRALAEDAGADPYEMTEVVRAADRLAAEQLAEPESLYGRLYLVKSAEASAFLRREPFRAARLALTEMARQFAAPQEFVFQLFAGPLPAWGRALGSVGTLVLWTCALSGGWALRGAGGNGRASWVLLGTLAFFLATGSVSHFVGARLRFPADVVAIPFFAVGLDRILAHASTRVDRYRERVYTARRR